MKKSLPCNSCQKQEILVRVLGYKSPCWWYIIPSGPAFIIHGVTITSCAPIGEVGIPVLGLLGCLKHMTPDTGQMRLTAVY